MGSLPSPPPPPPLSLAILMADTPLPGTQAKYSGTYGGVFAALFTAAVSPAPLSSALTITYHDVVSSFALETYPSLDEIDAILITGSKHNAYDDIPWISALVDFTAKALATGGKVKVVGVCFGHQIVGRAMGAPVAKTDTWEASVTEVELSREGKEFFGVDSLKIQQMHRDVVTRLPNSTPPTQNLGSTTTCAVQGMLYPDRAITVQGHPEFNEEIVREILELRHETGLHSDELYRDALARVGNEHDGVMIARAFLRFMRGMSE